MKISEYHVICPQMSICYIFRLADRQLLGELNADRNYLKSLICNPIWKSDTGINDDEIGYFTKEKVRHY